MRVKITADSTCDLSREIVDTLDIKIIPLYINTKHGTFQDGLDITPDDIYVYVDNHGELPKTSAVAVEDYRFHFEKYAAEYEAVIHLNIGAGFSSSHQNAVEAAKSFPNVYPIDSKNLSTGSGHIVMIAAQMAKEGRDVQEILDTINKTIPKVDASFVVDTMEYLYMGGRCSSVEKFGATILKIKPCIEVKEGKMAVGDKYRGDLQKSLKKYVGERLKNTQNIDNKRIFITHTKCPSGTVAMVRELIEKHMSFDEVIETVAGCTVTTHCGPGTLGILYLTK